MTNGEMIQSMFPNMNFGTLAQDDVIVNRDYSNNDEPQVFIPQSVWNAEYKEPITKIDYRRAFKIACDLLNGDILYGVDTNDIYELMMKKDGVVSSSSYEEYILNHLQELDQGQYASEPTTKNDTVSLETYMQVVKERDIAIEQLHELGYEFGEKIEPRKGHWIERHDDWGSGIITDKRYKCSVCHGKHIDPQTGEWHEVFDYKYPFCPNCGADMREVEE